MILKISKSFLSILSVAILLASYSTSAQSFANDLNGDELKFEESWSSDDNKMIDHTLPEPFLTTYTASAVCIQRGTGREWGNAHEASSHDIYRAERMALAKCEENCDGSCRITGVTRPE